MEIIDPPDYSEASEFMDFHGKGSTYFGIVVVNFILVVITFGLYYPWAKEKVRKYIWSESEYDDSRFTFHGTGREMFVGFLLAYIFLIIFYILYFAVLTLEEYYALWGLGFFMSVMFFWFVPFAIFSSWRYRMSRTSWRGIYFAYHGGFASFFIIYLKYFVITVFTFGIGYSWMKVALQKELFGHTSLGDLDMKFSGDGSDLFVINLVGYFLLYPTFGLYIPKWIKERFKFSIDNISLSDGVDDHYLKSHLSFSESFSVLVSNFFILIFTLGLAFPFTYMRYLKMLFRNVELPQGIDYDNINQVAVSPADATGDQLLDILDLDIDF